VFLADWYQRWTHYVAIRSRRPRPSRLRTVIQSIALAFVSFVIQAIVCAGALFAGYFLVRPFLDRPFLDR
jgi:hypothetical protein